MSDLPVIEDTKIQAAAEAIAGCDFLLVATGAGFSADSGLPTYTQVAENAVYQRQGIEYSDLCRVDCLRKQPALFYGFWGTCFNAYQEATPHAGYAILKQWCDHKDSKNEKVPSYYHYTSNVDGHLRKVGFPSSRIHEMHGSIDTWLVLEALDTQIGSSEIHLESSFRFPVDRATLEMNPDTLCKLFEEKTDILQQDVHFRPRVLMFDDGHDSHGAMGLQESSNRYQIWEEQMEKAMAQGIEPRRLVVLEIGCGVRVPSVRQECQDVVLDTALRCQAAGLKAETSCTHIRINPEDSQIPEPADCCERIETISIQGKAMSTLVAIDDRLQKLSQN